MEKGLDLFHVFVTVSVFYLVNLKVWKFFPEPDGKKPSPPEILVKFACSFIGLSVLFFFNVTLFTGLTFTLLYTIYLRLTLFMFNTLLKYK